MDYADVTTYLLPKEHTATRMAVAMIHTVAMTRINHHGIGNSARDKEYHGLTTTALVTLQGTRNNMD